jgi:hypothetical protein
MLYKQPTVMGRTFAGEDKDGDKVSFNLNESGSTYKYAGRTYQIKAEDQHFDQDKQIYTASYVTGGGSTRTHKLVFDEYNLNVKEHYWTETWSNGVRPEKLYGTNYPSNEQLEFERESPKKNKCQSIAIFVIVSLLLLACYRLKFATNIEEQTNFQGFNLSNYDLVWPS